MRIDSRKFILDGKLVDLMKCDGGPWEGRHKHDFILFRPDYSGDSGWVEIYRTQRGAYIHIDRWRGCCASGDARFITEREAKETIGALDADAYVAIFGECLEVA